MMAIVPRGKRDRDKMSLVKCSKCNQPHQAVHQSKHKDSQKKLNTHCTNCGASNSSMVNCSAYECYYLQIIDYIRLPDGWLDH